VDADASRFSGLDSRADFDVAVFWTFRNLGVGNVALARAADSRVRQMRLRELETLNAVRGEVAEAHAWVDAQYRQIDTAEKAVRASGEAYSDDLKRILETKGVPLEEMAFVAGELEREGFRIPLLIGGATTSRVHTAVKIEPNYKGPTVHVLDASRAVSVAGSLLSGTLRDGFVADVRREYEAVRTERSQRPLS